MSVGARQIGLAAKEEEGTMHGGRGRCARTSGSRVMPGACCYRGLVGLASAARCVRSGGARTDGGGEVACRARSFPLPCFVRGGESRGGPGRGMTGGARVSSGQGERAGPPCWASCGEEGEKEKERGVGWA